MLNFLTFYQLYFSCKSINYNTKKQTLNLTENNLSLTLGFRMNN